MGVPFGDNVAYQGTLPNFERDAYETIAAMKAMKDARLPKVFLGVCYEDGNVYKYTKTNEVDPVTGKWRLFSAGGDPIQVVSLPSAVSTLEGKIFQFVGETNSTYTNGYFYKCAEIDTDTYAWVQKNVQPSGGGGASAAEDVSYANLDHPTATNVKLALDEIYDKVFYVDPKVNSFNMTPATADYEIGSSVSDLAFTWSYNKEMVSQSLTDCTLADATVRSATAAGPYTSNKTFTLTANDGQKSVTSNKTISFKHKVYYGSAAEPSTFDSAFILALSGKKFATTTKGTYSMNVASGEYGFLAYPSSWGDVNSWWIGGFEVTTHDCGTISFTNASGNTTTFRIVRTTQAGLGNISAEVK